MTFTVLSDKHIQDILVELSPSDLDNLLEVLEQALAEYSTKNEGKYQPQRAAVTRSTGQVSLFMPATTQSLIGVKIVGVAPSPDLSTLPPGTKPQAGLKSVLTLCNELGQAIGVLNAAELTAFRTALGSMLIYRHRQTTKNIVVFGAGKQAAWHLRLAALLKGKDIERVDVVNRSSQRSKELIDHLTKSPQWPKHIDLRIAEGETGGSLETLVSNSDVIFCTTPSTKPLFPASFLTTQNSRNKGRYVAAIGSYRLDMAEIDPELLRSVADPSSVFSSQVWNGSIVVDSREGCMHEAGELVSSGVAPDKWVEIGNLESSAVSSHSAERTKWLENGFVIYKSVGVGVMDLAIGQSLLNLAREKDFGVSIDSF